MENLAKSNDIGAYDPHNLEAISAIVDAIVRSDNVTGAVQRCYLVLAGTLKAAHFLDVGNQHQFPLRLEPRALRTLKKITCVPEASVCVPLLEEYIGSTLIRSYRALLKGEHPHQRLSRTHITTCLHEVRAIAVLISCISDKNLLKDSMKFYLENFQNIFGSHTGEMPAYILFSELCYDLHAPSMMNSEASDDEKTRRCLARDMLENMFQLSSQPQKLNFKLSLLPSSQRDCLASFYEAAFSLAASERGFSLYNAVSSHYRTRHAKLLKSSKDEYRCVNAALQALGTLLDESPQGKNREGRADRVRAELTKMMAYTPHIAPDFYSLVTAMLGRPNTSTVPPSEEDVTALVQLSCSLIPPSAHHYRHKRGRERRQTAHSNVGIAIMEWCFEYVDVANHKEHMSKNAFKNTQVAYASSLHDTKNEKLGDGTSHQLGHHTLRDKDKVMLQDVALFTGIHSMHKRLMLWY